MSRQGSWDRTSGSAYGRLLVSSGDALYLRGDFDVLDHISDKVWIEPKFGRQSPAVEPSGSTVADCTGVLFVERSRRWTYGSCRGYSLISTRQAPFWSPHAAVGQGHRNPVKSREPIISPGDARRSPIHAATPTVTAFPVSFHLGPFRRPSSAAEVHPRRETLELLAVLNCRHEEFASWFGAGAARRLARMGSPRWTHL